jgi:hypothetical protein
MFNFKNPFLKALKISAEVESRPKKDRDFWWILHTGPVYDEKYNSVVH